MLLPEIVHVEKESKVVRFADIPVRGFFTLEHKGLFIKISDYSALILETVDLPDARDAGSTGQFKAFSPVIPVKVRIEVLP